LLGLEEGQEREGEIDEAGEVDADLVVEGGQIDLGGLGEVVGGLDAGVEEETIEVGVLGGDGLDEVVEVVGVVNVVGEAIGFAAVLANKVVNSLLSTADGDDFRAFADELFGHAEADARRGSYHKDALVGERHGALMKSYSERIGAVQRILMVETCKQLVSQNIINNRASSALRS